jgi:hypothetical protein
MNGKGEREVLMALITCRECSQQVSDQAVTCPTCGAPTRTVTTDSGHAPSTKKKRSRKLWIGGLLVLAFVVWLSQTREFKEARKEQTLPQLPIAVSFRSALLGPGLVLQVTNGTARHLTLLAEFENPTTQQTMRRRIDLAPHAEEEVGHAEGWAFASGDTLILSHNDYKSWHGAAP